MEQTLNSRPSAQFLGPASPPREGRAPETVAVGGRPVASRPGVEAAPEVTGRLERLVPLWRHAVWLVALFALLAMWIDIRVDVQQVRKDLDRTGRAHREAQIQNDRLQLELDARRRSLVLESAARELAVGDQARLVRVVEEGH